MEAVGIIGTASAQRKQLNAEARLAERQVKDIDLQSLQASGQRRAALNDSLSTIDALRASSGLDLDSPTAQAIERQTRLDAVTNEKIEQVGFNNQKFAARYGAQIKRAGAKNVMTAGYIDAFNKTGQAVAKAYAAGA